jgi:hypothetical protein
MAVDRGSPVGGSDYPRHLPAAQLVPRLPAIRAVGRRICRAIWAGAHPSLGVRDLAPRPRPGGYLFTPNARTLIAQLTTLSPLAPPVVLFSPVLRARVQSRGTLHSTHSPHSANLSPPLTSVNNYGSLNLPNIDRMADFSSTPNNNLRKISYLISRLYSR